MANTSRKRTSRPRSTARQSSRQRESIANTLGPILDHDMDAIKSISQSQQYKYIAWNIFLVGLQLYNAVYSNSPSLRTAAIDSIINNLCIIARDIHKATGTYRTHIPVVTPRIETAGRITVAFMISSILTVLAAFKVQDLLSGRQSVPSPFSIIIMSGTFIVKLGVFVYGVSWRHEHSQTLSSHMDRPSSFLINGLGILMSISGLKVRWWLDPLGAILLSLFISGTWLQTLIHEFNLLIGVSADAQTQSLLKRIALAHDDRVVDVASVHAYHAGPRLIVELDIVMIPNETLRASHDVAEQLRCKLESFAYVERAIVRVVYGTHDD